MSLEAGQPWGAPGVVPADAVFAAGDAEAARIAFGAPVVLRGGDLHRGLGSPAAKSVGENCTRLPVDVMDVVVETPSGRRALRAVAHLSVGRLGARHGVSVVVNAGFVDGLDLAPRGHPGDGTLEVVTFSASMSWRQRREALRRARTGTHLPHPDISVGRARTWSIGRSRREPLMVDGVDVGEWSSVEVRVVPGALEVLV